MNKGFVPVWRSLFVHELWTEKRVFSRAEAWLDLLQSTSWQDGTQTLQGKQIAVARGEQVASLRYLGTRWDWSPMKVDRFLKTLERETMILRETRQGETVLILCKYEVYNSAIPVGETATRQQTRQARDSGRRKNLENRDGERIENETDKSGITCSEESISDRSPSLGETATRQQTRQARDSEGAKTRQSKQGEQRNISPLPPSAPPPVNGAGRKLDKAREPKAGNSELPPDPRFAPVTEGYCSAYLETFGSPYVHNGGREGKRLKQFLATASPSEFSVERIIKIARAAMDRSKKPYAKATKFASSLITFCDQFNAIRAELIDAAANGHAIAPTKARDPTPEQVGAWLATRPDYANKRVEWTTWDRVPPGFPRDEYWQHHRQSKQPAETTP